jgi:hypothetical protein
MTDPLEQARKAQAAKRLNALAGLQAQVETLGRVVICLARMIDGQIECARAGEHLAVPNKDMEDASTHFALDIRPLALQENRELKEGEEEIPKEVVWVVSLTPRGDGDGNGQLVVPGGPKLVVP